MPRQENHADPESLLGQLQRGRGEGFLRLLAIPRAEAWTDLLDCICNDPRLDSQVEARAEYYAALAIETELELDPLLRYLRDFDDEDQGWNTPLAVETLGELAKRSYKDAAEALCDYVRWGQWWHWTLDDLCARECLWDCEDQTRQIGAQTVSLDAPDTTDRVRQMASDCWEDEEVRAAASQRVSF